MLAAGKGTRMRSSRPKCLHEAAGRTLVGHVVAACMPLVDEGAGLWVVVSAGPEGSAVAAAAAPATPVVQTAQRGTGDALAAVLPSLPERGTVVVLNGDMPLVPTALVREVVATHCGQGAGGTLVSVRMPDPTGYGRVLREADGRFSRVVEHADAGERERQVDEINVGVYAFDLAVLRDAIGGLRADNAQGEVYLPDLFPLVRAAGRPVAVVVAADPGQVAGVNTQAELAAAADALMRRHLRTLGGEGVRLASLEAVRVDVTAGVARGAWLGAGSEVQGASRIDAGASLDGALVGDAWVRAGARLGPGTRIGPVSNTAQGVDASGAKPVGTAHPSAPLPG